MRSSLKTAIYIASLFLIIVLKGVLYSKGVHFGFTGWFLFSVYVAWGYDYFIRSENSPSYIYVKKYLLKYMNIYNLRHIDKIINHLLKKNYEKARLLLNRSDVHSPEYAYLNALLEAMQFKNYSTISDVEAMVEAQIIQPFGDYYYILIKKYKEEKDLEKVNLIIEKWKASEKKMFTQESF